MPKTRKVRATISYTKVVEFEVPVNATKEEIEQEFDDTDLSHVDYEPLTVGIWDYLTNDLISLRNVWQS